MSSKGFRGIHGAKTRSSSSSFISLHFNKADEDQIEISYNEDKKCKDSNSETHDTSQSNLTCTNQDSEAASKSLPSDAKDFSASDSFFKSYLSRKKANSFGLNEGREDVTKNVSKSAEEVRAENSTKNFSDGVTKLSQSTESIKSFTKDESDSNAKSTNFIDNAYDNILKLSPAIEAAELGDENLFDNYISDELEKAKCEIIDPKTQMSSSYISSQSKQSLPNKSILISSKTDKDLLEDCCTRLEKCDDTISKLSQETEEGTLFSVIKRCSDFANFARNSVKFHILIAILACLFAPIPSWLSGFFTGSIISSFLVYWLYKPLKNVKSYLNYNFIETENVQLAEVKNDAKIFKGWMNELPSFMSYNPDKYHVSCTRSLYVRLDGSYLRFSFPLRNIPKRAMFNEPRHELQFVHQQHYDITGATVELLPKGLANKRLWSKKYPICVKIPNLKDTVLSNSSKQDAVDISFSSKTALKKESFNKKFAPRINENNEVVLYLFSRTDRDKNLWYSRFVKASRMKIARPHSPVSSPVSETDSILENKRAMSVDFATLQFSSSDPSKQSMFYNEDDELDSFVEINISKQQKFEMYMSRLLTPLHSDSPYSFSSLKKETKDASDKKVSKSSNRQSNLMWLNSLMGRLFFDFLVEDVWAQLVTEKIQKKLNRLKLPFFLNELTVKDIHLGSALPKIHHASEPSDDERGMWIDIDLSYNGSFHMTLETKLNLLKLKGDPEEMWSSLSEPSETTDHPLKSPVYNSDEEDSAESSSDDDVPLPDVSVVDSIEESAMASTAGSTSKKLLKFVDRLAQSPYFQNATKNKYVKKYMEDISNTPLVLTVEVQWLTGTLALNIPPWPTNRLWYGFRTNPSLCITARPMLGQKVVTFTHVTEWIEKKLVSEFQKVLVMPNMDDLIIPIMQPHLETPDV